MRSLGTNAVIAGLLAHSVAATTSACLQENVISPADRCYSSDAVQLEECIAGMADDLTQQGLQACFLDAGCDEPDAKVEAEWALEACLDQEELRRRQLQNEDEPPRTTPVDPRVTPSAPDLDVAPVGHSRTTQTAALPLELRQATLECFTTITFTTEGYEVVGTFDGKVSSSFNSQKVATKTKCADGLVCRGTQCMEAVNELETSGIAVAIFLGCALIVAIGTIIFLCMKDRRADKRIRAKAEAAKIAKEAKEAALPPAGPAGGRGGARRSPSGADRQPLMNQGMYPSSPGGSARPSHDPFGDNTRKA